MRTLARILINLVLLAATLAVCGWLTTQPVYLHASHDKRSAMLIGVVIAFFAVACIALYLVPSAKQLAKRQARKKAGSRAAYPYGAAKRAR